VVAKVRESLAVSKQTVQGFDGETFNLTKLDELEVRKEYQIEITNNFAALGNLIDEEDINRKGNVKTSAKECLCLQELKQQSHDLMKNV